MVTGFGFLGGNIPREEDREGISEMNDTGCEIWRKPEELQKHEEPVSP